MLRKTTASIKKEHQKKVLERVQERQRLGQKEDDMDQIELPIVYTDEVSMEMEKTVRLSKLNASTNTRTNFIELRVPYYCDEYESNIRLKVD